MEFLKIVALGVLAAVTYGIVHDQVTVRVCLEYFTVGHPQLISSTSPTLLALAWGVVATWWVGLPLGFALAVTSRAGNRPKLAAAALLPLVLPLLGAMAVCALLAGIAGYLLASHGFLGLYGQVGDVLPYPVHARFLADLWAHNASYLSGIIGGVIVAAAAYRRRIPNGHGAA
jgi:hypothetical protein